MKVTDVIKKLEIKEPYVVNLTKNISCPHKQSNGDIFVAKVELKKYVIHDPYSFQQFHNVLIGNCYCGKTYINENIE